MMMCRSYLSSLVLYFLFPPTFVWQFDGHASNHFFAAAEEDSWTFLVMPDQHVFTPFSFDKDSEETQKIWTESLRILKAMKEDYGGDLVLISGDSAQYGNLSLGDIQAMTGIAEAGQAVYTAGVTCYRMIRELFKAAGFDELLVAVGDHELGGNKGFFLGAKGNKSKVLTVPASRKAFADGYNKNENESFLFNDAIGNVTSRPLGTTFEDTSFAYRKNNVLFITVDVFKIVGHGDRNYFDKINGFGGEGVITCDVSGAHLNWFEDVLREAKKDLNIKHIIVQGHVPIILPVRKVTCSGQFLDGADDSGLWKIMSKYGVDVYFAGEVHTNTASKSRDPESGVVQIVARGRTLSNFITVQVSDDVLDIALMNEIGEKQRWNGNYEESGHLTIDKSNSSNIIVSASGELELIDPDSSLIKFDFEEILPLGSRQVLGLFGPDKLMATSVVMRGINCTDSMMNKGSFGAQYDAQVGNVVIVPGREGGSSAGLFLEDSRFGIFGVGPNGGGEIVSFSMWIKTTESDSNMTLAHYGATFGKKAEVIRKAKKNHMMLALESGVPVLYINPRNKLTSASVKNIADGNWHHIAVSMPKKSPRLFHIQIFVDFVATTTRVWGGKNPRIFQTTSGKLSIGGFGHSSEAYDVVYKDMKPFQGLIDDFSLWTKRLVQRRDGFKINANTKCVHVRGAFEQVEIQKSDECIQLCVDRGNEKCRGFQVTADPPSCTLYVRVPELSGEKVGSQCGTEKVSLASGWNNNPTQSMKPSSTPTISPTSLNPDPSKAPRKRPSYSPSALNTCINTSDFKFILDNDNEQDCAWFTRQSEKTERRKEKYCPREEIAYNCQLACDKCTIDAPSASPSFICEDSTSFVFQLFFNGEFRGCDWLTKNSSQASKRIKRYCPTEYEGTFIKDACSLSCGDCATSTTITTRTNIFG